MYVWTPDKHLLYLNLHYNITFTHPCVVPDLYDLLSSAENKPDIFKNVIQ